VRRVVLLALLSCLLYAKPVDLGEKVSPMTLPDQFGKKHRIDASSCPVLLITAQKDVSIRLKDFILKQHPDFLQRHHACFLSDIHEMPGFVTRWFALPKMRKYPFKVLLIYEKGRNPFPVREDAVTAFTLGKGNVVTSIRYVKDPDKLF